jgi:hypothetical protein
MSSRRCGATLNSVTVWTGLGYCNMFRRLSFSQVSRCRTTLAASVVRKVAGHQCSFICCWLGHFRELERDPSRSTHGKPRKWVILGISSPKRNDCLGYEREGPGPSRPCHAASGCEMCPSSNAKYLVFAEQHLHTCACHCRRQKEHLCPARTIRTGLGPAVCDRRQSEIQLTSLKVISEFCCGAATTEICNLRPSPICSRPRLPTI